MSVWNSHVNRSNFHAGMSFMPTRAHFASACKHCLSFIVNGLWNVNVKLIVSWFEERFTVFTSQIVNFCWKKVPKKTNFVPKFSFFLLTFSRYFLSNLPCETSFKFNWKQGVWKSSLNNLRAFSKGSFIHQRAFIF